MIFHIITPKQLFNMQWRVNTVYEGDRNSEKDRRSRKDSRSEGDKKGSQDKRGGPLEIFTGKEGEIVLKKYSPMADLTAFAQQYVEAISQSLGLPVAITDGIQS